MSFAQFLKIITKNLLWLILIPVVLAASIYYFTRHEKKIFASETTIYTGVASGYSLSGNNKADFFATSNAFDNLLSIIGSRETRLAVIIDLLSEHIMLTRHDPEQLSWEPYKQLNLSFPDSLRKKLVKPTLEATKKAVMNYMLSSDDNWVAIIINSSHPFYSINTMKSIKALRISMSDLIKISYETEDGAICKRTLELLSQEFMNKHRFIKEGQSESVVKYFEDETKNAFSRLDSNEAIFLDFNKKNDIINYYEQTRNVAHEKELLFSQKHNLEMDKMADDKTLQTVNTNLEGRVYKILNGTDIINEREKLSDIKNKIAVTEILEKSKPANQQHSLDSMRKIEGTFQKNLTTSMDKLYAESNTPNGIPTRNVLDEWLKSTLAFEQSKAKLTVMDKRKKEFQDEYRKFAPLGAMLKKIERQIGVSEQEYLELLHGLSVARLTQQNTELTTKLTVLDAPFLPLSPLPSKRIIQIIMGFVVGFVLVLAILLAKALTNSTMQQPLKMKKTIGIPLLGIYPLLNEQPSFLAKANLRLLQKVLSKIDVSKKPFVIGLISAQKIEGKSTLNELFYHELMQLNFKVEKKQWKPDYFGTHAKDTEIVLLELPALNELAMKPGGMPEIDQALLICRANRQWTKVDAELLGIFTKLTGKEPMSILNGVEKIFAAPFIGGVEKKQSKLSWLLEKIRIKRSPVLST